MSSSRSVILLACGSFNPVTNMHLRMFELARDYLRNIGTCVLDGLISPVHDGYGKAGLISSTHRCNMIEGALETSNWIKLDRWESEQNGWSTTCSVLKHHQTKCNENYMRADARPEVKLLIGADVLESFSVPNLWKSDDIEYMAKNHGFVVITRIGNDPQEFITKSEVLSRYKSNIHVVYEWIVNEVKSTSIRNALKEGRSVKYLIQDQVIKYIQQNELYGSK